MQALDVTCGQMPKKKEPLTAFGARLIAARKARGLTQTQLADAIGTSQRAISSYESTTAHPPAPVIAKMSAALGITADELLGVEHPRSTKLKIELERPEVRRLWKKFQKLLELPEKDQRAVIRLLNSLAGPRSSM
jgi:transcriptional regulator with XRE-family HTH domain